MLVIACLHKPSNPLAHRMVSEAPAYLCIFNTARFSPNVGMYMLEISWDYFSILQKVLVGSYPVGSVHTFRLDCRTPSIARTDFGPIPMAWQAHIESPSTSPWRRCCFEGGHDPWIPMIRWKILESPAGSKDGPRNHSEQRTFQVFWAISVWAPQVEQLNIAVCLSCQIHWSIHCEVYLEVWLGPAGMDFQTRRWFGWNPTWRYLEPKIMRLGDWDFTGPSSWTDVIMFFHPHPWHGCLSESQSCGKLSWFECLLVSICHFQVLSPFHD